MNTLAPPVVTGLDASASGPQPDPAALSVRPFGLTLTAPVALAEEPVGPLAFCPERQLTVTGDGEPFIHAPSMKTAFKTTSQTREDMQLATDTDNDTD
ncbi:putative ATP-grasp-modified RiPP [Streptomyces sp. NPDC020412]|uniref:putative ATP-grasp-modified RiPP n=1 Tax=Streptomyces sp. NPDC020412 TaxID=3365073 RepID=UPI0037B1CB91